MFVPSVIVIERFGIKTALLISVSLAMIGSTFALLIDNMGAEIFGQLIVEAGFPLVVSCTTKVPALWFPYRERIFATSFVILGGLIGFTFGDASLEIFVGLRYAYALCILIAGGIAITLLLMLFKERPEQPPSES
jgi:MFS family permease